MEDEGEGEHAGGAVGTAFRKEHHDENTGEAETVRHQVVSHQPGGRNTPRLCLEELSLLPGKDLPVHHAGHSFWMQGKPGPGGGQGHVSSEPGPRVVRLEALAAFLTATLPPSTAGTRHPPACSVTGAHRTARALGFGSCPWQGSGAV